MDYKIPEFYSIKYLASFSKDYKSKILLIIYSQYY